MVVLICISLIISDAEHFSHLFADHLYIFLGEQSIQVFCRFFYWVIGFVTVELYKLLIHSRD